MTQIGSLGIGLSVNVSLAISPATAVAYVSTPSVVTGTSTIYTINLATAVPTQVGVVDAVLIDMAVLPPSTVQVAATTTGALESAGTASVVVTRTGDTRVPTTVQFATGDGSAISGSDYVATSGSLEFSAGVTSRTIQVPVISDGVFEAPETFTLTLSNAAGGSTLGASVTSTVTITQAVDKTAPKVLALPLLARSVRVIGRSGVVSTFSCSEACTASAKLLAGRKAIGTAKSVKLASAGIGALRVKTTKLGQARLVALAKGARTHRVKLTFVLTVRDPSGNARVLRLPVVAVR